MSRCAPCGCRSSPRRSGLPVPTIKYYLREGLLHPGEAVGATRARYDDSHVRRLRLVRALTEVAGMRLEDVRRVLVAIDDPSLVLARGDRQCSHAAARPSAPAATTTPRSGSGSTPCSHRHDWELDEHSPHRDGAGRRAGVAAPRSATRRRDELLDIYAEAADLISEREVGLDRRDRPGRSGGARGGEHAAARAGAAHPAADRPGERLRRRDA